MTPSFRSPSNVVRRLKLTPLVSRKVTNWPTFMYHYALGLVPRVPYVLRGGARLKIGRGVDHVPIIEIFLRQDYGEVPDDSVIVDLGANIGAFSVYAATTAHNVRVYAYEPVPSFFKAMQLNVQLNGLERAITCFNAAVAGDVGERYLAEPGPGFQFPTLLSLHSAPLTGLQAHCTTLATILDRNALARIDLLKIDIEGAEYETIYATPRNCFERIGEIRMEYHDLDQENRNVRALRQFLIAQGYRITRHQRNTPTNGNLWAEHHA